MRQHVRWKGAVREGNLDVQTEERLVYDLPPFSTDVGKFAPPEFEVPALLVVQSTVVEYCEENSIAVERIGGCMQYGIPRLH